MYHAKRNGGDRIDVFKPPCARANPTGCRSNPTCGARSSAKRSPSFISRSCGSTTARRRLRGAGALEPSEARADVAGEFITIAEETGLIVELGLFVLERTARQLSTWQRTLRPRDRCSPASTCPRGNCCATI
jgi:hypothetical protein